MALQACPNGLLGRQCRAQLYLGCKELHLLRHNRSDCITAELHNFLNCCTILHERGKQVVASRSGYDLVVYIRHIHHIRDIVTKVVLQHTANDVKGDVVSCMADVRAIVYGGAATIPVHVLAVRASARNERGFLI